MTKRETGIYEWFDMLSGETDQTTFRVFLSSLNGYQGPVTNDDLIQLINFVTGVRLHQMKQTMKRTQDALEATKKLTPEEIKNSNSPEAQAAAREMMTPKDPM